MGLALQHRVRPGHAVLATAAGAALAVVGLVDPSRHRLGPPCPLRTLTGLDCPFCGATRATHALLRADLATAADFNALYVAALPVAVLALVAWVARGRWPVWTRRPAARWLAVALLVGFAVARNLPVPALQVLASTPLGGSRA